jgi:hypothetical protein
MRRIERMLDQRQHYAGSGVGDARVRDCNVSCNRRRDQLDGYAISASAFFGVRRVESLVTHPREQQ